MSCTALHPPVRIRRLRRGERRPVLEVFAGLSERSRGLRFLGPKPRLGERELATLVDVGAERQAVVAIERSTGRTVGVARFAPDGDGTAEVAFAVVDAWQGRGVGRLLADELREVGLGVGLTHFTATVAAGNAAAAALLRRLGEPVEMRI
ncbi:MAG TPA: GNAT family N-acetyltransferase, partial [Gaiellaceae bacterium]|nr:GNAT family N-acetyltransferase [Gaiellaceae bacterium]